MEAQPKPAPARAQAPSPRRRWLVIVIAFLLGLGVAGAAGYHFGSRYLEAKRHWEQALESIEKHELGTASDHLQACLSYWPSDPEVRLIAARTYRRRGDFALALEHLVQARQLKSSAQDVALENVLLGIQQHGLTPTEARTLEPHFQSHSKEEVLILEAIAKSYLSAQQNAEARKWLNRWIEHYPDAWIARYWRGQLALANGDMAAAVHDLEQANLVRPDHEELERLLTIVQLRVGRCRDAAVHLVSYLQRHPDDPAALADLARCQRRLNQVADARATLERLFVMHPDHAAGLLTYAQLEADSENSQAALLYLERLERQSMTELFDVVEAASLAVSVRRALGQDKEAERCERRLRQLQKDIEDLTAAQHKFDKGATGSAQRLEIGALLLRVGLDVAAENWLQGVVDEQPDHQQAHELLAGLYDRRGDPQSRLRAEEHRRRAKGSR